MASNLHGRTRKHRTGAASSTERSKSLLERAPWPLGARNHCSSLLFGCWALEIIARACFLERLTATERSKSVLEHASFSFEATERSKCLLERASKPLSTRNHCSSMLLFHSKALSSMLLFPSKALSTLLLFPSRFLSKSLCFELCIASSCTLCDFTGAVRRHMRI